jgi:hypothetical protein
LAGTWPSDRPKNTSNILSRSFRLWSPVEGILWALELDVGLIRNQIYPTEVFGGARSRRLRCGFLKPARALLSLCVIGLATQLWTQQVGPGSIQGTVVDKDGAVLEGARVSLDQPASSTESETAVTSDGSGHFSFGAVPPGTFKITVSSTGFAPQSRSGVLHSGESFDADAIALLMSGTASEVHVTASQVEIAEAQIKVEETQRVLGVLPNFYVSYAPHPAPLNTKQKFELAWKTSIDPVSFLAAGAFAGVQQADDTFSGYGEGAAGYGARFGADFGDNLIGTMIGAAILPSLLKQDPRYFYKGTGSRQARALYAIAMAVVCKGDNGHWQPSYSAILGGLAAGGISNFYYPASSRDGVRLTFENALFGTAASAAQNLFQEFIVRRFTPRLPNYGAGQP